MHHKLRIGKLPTIVLVILMTSVLFSINIVSTLAQDPLTGGVEGCIVTDEILHGQGDYVLTGLGDYVLTGLGDYVLTGLGSDYVLTGLGDYVLTGLGELDELNPPLTQEEIQAIFDDINNNLTTPDWLVELLRQTDIDDGPGFNAVRVAMVVVDDFNAQSAALEHGELIRLQLESLINAVNNYLGTEFSAPPVQVDIVEIDISDSSGYNIELLANAIRSEVDRLRGSGYDRVIVNASIGAVIPCEVMDADGNVIFDFDDFLEAREDALNEPTLEDIIEETGANEGEIVPILECVREYEGGVFEIRYGYLSLAEDTVEIPIGNNNRFRPGAQDRGQPTTFEPGYHETVFVVTITGGNLNWHIKYPTRNNPTGSSANAPACTDTTDGPEVNDFNLIDYLPDGLNIADLIGLGDNDDYTAPLDDQVFCYISDLSQTDPTFRGISSVSSGNFAPLLGTPVFDTNGNIVDYTAAPLYPASSPCTVAVGSTLGDDINGNPEWIGSHDGDVFLPGTWFEFVLEDDVTFAANGTSFAAPFFSIIGSLYLGYEDPNICDFSQVDGDGNALPPLDYSVVRDGGGYANVQFIPGTPNPLLCSFEDGGSITISKDVTPDTVARGFRFFSRDFEDRRFTLRHGESNVVENLDEGTYTIRERNTNNAEWFLRDVDCYVEGEEEYGTSFDIDLESATVVIELAEGEDANCTFYNERYSRITVTKFNDLNENGRRNGRRGEETLAGWEMILYDNYGEGREEIARGFTNANGNINFRSLPTGDYTVCEVQQPGWVNVSPDDAYTDYYGNSCVDVTLESAGSRERVNFGNIFEAPEISATCNSAFATNVVEFNQGLRDNYSPVNSSRSNPQEALGIPEDIDEEIFVSLGFGGEIILEFSSYILANPDGPEVSIVETSYGNVSYEQYSEEAEVLVAQSLEGPWISLGTAFLDEDLDFPPGLLWARYVKIVDTSSRANFGGSADGFDVDGVSACVSDDDEPETAELIVIKTIVDGPDEYAPFTVCLVGPLFPTGNEVGACHYVYESGDQVSWTVFPGTYEIHEVFYEGEGENWEVEVGDGGSNGDPVPVSETTRVELENVYIGEYEGEYEEGPEDTYFAPPSSDEEPEDEPEEPPIEDEEPPVEDDPLAGTS